MPDVINISNPKRVRGDQGEVEMNSAQDTIAADQYNAAAKVTGPFAGIRFGRVIPPKQVDLDDSTTAT